MPTEAFKLVSAVIVAIAIIAPQTRDLTSMVAARRAVAQLRRSESEGDVREEMSDKEAR